MSFDSANVFSFTNNGETGDKGGGTFGVLPGGEDDLDSAWVVFRLQLAVDDRPVSINLECAKVLPGGEDDLDSSYWLAAYSFSQARWDWLDPPAGYGDPARPGAWSAVGTVPLALNSEQLRQRYCNLASEVYICVLVEPKARAGTWCGVTIQPSTLDFANKVEAGYFKTEPLPATIANSSESANEIALTLVEGEPGEPDRTYVDRREGSGTSAARRASTMGWVRLGYVDSGVTNFIDTTPVAGMTYEYRAVAAVLDGNRALRAAFSNSASAQLSDTWTQSQLSGLSVNTISLAVVNGNPAVAYCDHTQGTSRVNYQRASTADGASAGDWSAPVELDVSTSNNDGDVDLREVNGTPAVCYTDHGDRTLRYKRCTSPDGSNIADWPPAPVVVSFPGGETVRFHAFAVVGGHPAVAYQNTAGPVDAGVYIWSSTVGGDSAGDWAVHAVPGGTQSFDCPSLAAVNNAPAISFYNSNGLASNHSFNYIRATTPTGEQTLDWPPPVVLQMPAEFSTSTLLPTAGCPAILRADGTFNTLSLLRAVTADGSQAGDWNQQFTFAEPLRWDPASENMAIIGGRPAAVGVSPANQIIYFDASTAAGSDLSMWSSADTNLNGQYVTVAEVSGKPALAYRAGGGQPTFAILQ